MKKRDLKEESKYSEDSDDSDNRDEIPDDLSDKLIVVSNKLAEESWVKGLNPIFWRVPVIKFEDKHTNIKVDITFDNNSGKNGLNLIKEVFIKYPLAKEMAYVLKIILSAWNL